MKRVVNRTAQIIVDLLVLATAYSAAFYVRFDGELPLQMLKRLAFTWPYVVGFQFILLTIFGVRRYAWRYVGLRETTRIFLAVGTAGVALLMARTVAAGFRQEWGYLQYVIVPAGVIVIDGAIAFLGITGVRAIRRIHAERSEQETRRAQSERPVTPTLLVGAGQAGVLVAKEIAGRPDMGIVPVGFVDDDAVKVGTVVHGIPVVGTSAKLAELCATLGAKQVLITIANASGTEIRRIARLCESVGLPVKIIPGLYEIVGGQLNLSRIRPIAIEDLLGREPVSLDLDAISAVVRGKVVLVTGAGGSIGSELCRQLCRFGPSKLLLLERAENNLFEIHRELEPANPRVEVVPLLADICDETRIRRLLEVQRPAAVFHAAAHKHVPMMEWNAGEAVKNNVFGTKCLADAAAAVGVDVFVQVSTDKAVNPTSVMGASKRVAEMYLQSLARSSGTRFVTVRFGNVLGSAGSVVRIFKDQIGSGGPVKVTHPDMRRYFMLTAEACQLVLEAASFAQGGEIFLLDMGKPVRIVDLARDMIRLSGYEPDVDIKIEFSGIRPGEKLFEELLSDSEAHERTVHPKILVGRIPPVSPEDMSGYLMTLRHAVDEPADRVRAALSTVVPEGQLEMRTGAGLSGAAERTVMPALAGVS